ncbi:hypothetical protein M9Y10_043661 [Tritrichomonas musculus]|uniref:Uncharacterized protein n=1 Tax=Tritrichomonas musculus TaxID=1915356 RepID=A0ABR2K0R2_9EUKA
MSKNLESYRESVRDRPDEVLKDLRPGTKELLAVAAPKKKEGITAHFDQLVSIVFALMGLNNTFSQLVIAFKWLPTLPSMAIILLIKEFLGFGLLLLPTLNVLTKRPEKTPIFQCIIDPFPQKGIPPFLKSWLYAICCLSNLRIVLTLIISVKYDISLPYDTTDFDLQKVGNLLVTIVDIVIKTKDESKAVNFWLFTGLLSNLFFIILGINGHIKHYQATSAWFADLAEGKLSEDAVELGLESMYKFQYGQMPETPLVASSNNELLSKLEAVKDLVKKKEE